MEFKLKVVPSDKPITCGSGDKCATCRIGPNGSKFCDGCNGHCGPNGGSRLYKCNRECMTCGGGEMSVAPNICCKSPLADLALDAVERDSYKWKRRPRIELEQQGIIVTQGAAGRVMEPYHKNNKCVAVNLRHVWSKNGWYSRDMRDYLRIPKGTKLMLLTMTHDDVLERAWDRGVHEEDYSELGFDYWQPLTFSQYGDDARMTQYWALRRTLLATEKSKAWFAPFPPPLLSRGIDPLLLECVESIPQVMFNAQFNNGADNEIMGYLRMMTRSHRLFPKDVPFWFVGTSTVKIIKLLKSFLKGRRLYFMATIPWLGGHKGMAFSAVTGKTTKSTLPKDELVRANQQAFMDLCANS